VCEESSWPCVCLRAFVYVERVRGCLELGYLLSLPGLYHVWGSSSWHSVQIRGFVRKESSWVSRARLSAAIFQFFLHICVYMCVRRVHGCVCACACLRVGRVCGCSGFLLLLPGL